LYSALKEIVLETGMLEKLNQETGEAEKYIEQGIEQGANRLAALIKSGYDVDTALAMVRESCG